MTSNELIKKFYTSFANGDATTMIDCYHDEIVFEDPAFGQLKGDKAKAMWQMLLSRNSDIKIEFKLLESTETAAMAQWIATYFYGNKKRKVINKVLAKFELKDGLIIKHTDDFDLWKWTKQALGFSGYLLGWSSFMKSKIQVQTNTLLKNYMAK